MKNRKFSSYEEVFSQEEEKRIFNANKALEALSKSVSITRSGGMCIDYSVVIPVLVNTLSELHSFFSALENSRLRAVVGSVVDQLFAVQSVVSALGSEQAELEEEKARSETQQSVSGLASTAVTRVLRQMYLQQLPLHLTQSVDFTCFVGPSFDMSTDPSNSEADRNLNNSIVDSVMTYRELVESDVAGVRILLRGVRGSGKSTVLRQMARSWASSGLLLFNGRFDVVILLSLDALLSPAYSDLKQVSIGDLVFREIVQHDEDLVALLPDRQEVENWLHNSNNRILWLLDGLEALDSTGVANSNISNFLASLQTCRVEDELLKHRILASEDLSGKIAVNADL